MENEICCVCGKRTIRSVLRKQVNGELPFGLYDSKEEKNK
jgi:hypothetical protein